PYLLRGVFVRLGGYPCYKGGPPNGRGGVTFVNYTLNFPRPVPFSPPAELKYPPKNPVRKSPSIKKINLKKKKPTQQKKKF
ncbi:hypothetical protein ACVGWC_21670, partial [Enterobacter hormaechei]